MIPFSEVVRRIQARILFVTGMPDQYVRVVVSPNPRFADYVPVEGVTIRVLPPRPAANSGAGRWGYVVTRPVQVVVATMNLSDFGGQDVTAALAHLDLEDKIIDGVHDFNPAEGDSVRRIGITCKWTGGSEMERQVKADPAMVVSALEFEVVYPQVFTRPPG